MRAVAGKSACAIDRAAVIEVCGVAGASYPSEAEGFVCFLGGVARGKGRLANLNGLQTGRTRSTASRGSSSRESTLDQREHLERLGPGAAMS
jgi:hypothetical protein